MRYYLALVCLLVMGFNPAKSAEVSVERGLYISIITGCHDCHTKGYHQSGGNIDPEAALRGSDIGFQGEWGTSYPSNLRIVAESFPEDEFVFGLRHYQGAPPMPWHNIRKMDESDLRSLHRYIRSLGEPGKRAPPLAGPGEKVRTPYIVLMVHPASPCTRDLDCGVGEICGTAEPRQCVAR